MDKLQGDQSIANKCLRNDDHHNMQISQHTLHANITNDKKKKVEDKIRWFLK
jgi:hypothetical protein